MLTSIPVDCLEIILRQSNIETYYSCQILNKLCFNMIKPMKLNVYFAKNRLENILKKNLTQNCIKFCTNSRCPNKLHTKDSITVLKEKDLDVELMMEYKNILSSFRKEYIDDILDDIYRFDKTVTYEFINLKEICKIRDIPYCQDCLLDYNEELYNAVPNLSLDEDFM